MLILVIGIIFSCTVCSGLDSFADKLKSGAEQLNKDVAIGKSNACIINELITKILEGDKRWINGEKVQSIEIHYRFIGNPLPHFVIVAEMHWKLLKEPDIFSRQCKVPLPMRGKAA